MTSCPLPNPPVAADTPHTRLPADLQQQRADISRAGCVDFKGCNVSTVVLAFNEYDHARFDAGRISHSIETWPDDAKAKMRNEIDRFSERNGGAKIIAVTMAIAPDPRGFILALHWRPKA
ncbi:hypothetical protein [Rhodopseudomonas sp. RCAM05734]|uniref:hypothetical protein n=1 Tax=Rhodopseudomonas sp. RCAM05734 TaxID=3457549 RepID=UPI004043B484